MANEMLARAADRGDTGQSPNDIARRMFKFYVSQGLTPDDALAQVKRLMDSGLYSDVEARRQPIADRALDTIRRTEQQAGYRSNPRLLGQDVAAPPAADLPGYDPTASATRLPRNEIEAMRPRVTPQSVGEFNRRVDEFNNYRAPEIPSFSQPMTAAEAQELRATRPMVIDTRPSWLREPAPRAIPMSKAALDASPSGFTVLDIPSSRGMAQTYAPAAEGRPILNAGQEPPRTAGLAAASAPAGTAASAQPAPAAAGSQVLAPLPVRPMDSTLYGEDPSPTYSGYGGSDSPREILVQRALAHTAAPAKRAMQAPMPPPRPQELASAAPSQPAPAISARNLFTRYNESDSPADFISASNALLRERPDMTERYGRAEGGGIPEGMMGARPMPMPSLDLSPMGGPAPMGDMPPLGAMGPAPNKPAGAGAGAGGRDAAINKALEIIHHLVIRGR